MEPKVSLQGYNDDESTSRLEAVEACELTTTEDEEGSIQSNKDSKRKSPPPNIQASTHTKQPKKLLISSDNSKQRKTMSDHARKQKARQHTNDLTGS
jgi:hypothetical protein